MDVKATPTGTEETRQAWVAPSFERLPLNEAMTGTPIKDNHVSDGPSTYT
jgi:hypothetical protein